MEKDVVNQKYKIVIVSTNFLCGGVEKSLVSFLNCLDYEKVTVDLLLRDHIGELRTMIPEPVHILPPIESEYCGMPYKKAIPEMIKKGQYRDLLYRVLKTISAKTGISYLNDEMAVHLLNKQVSNYDLKILYDFSMFRFFHYLVSGKKSAIFIHFDAKELFKDWNSRKLKSLEGKICKLDAVFCVSNYCMQSLLAVFPRLKNKITIFHNILNEEEIILKSQEEQFKGLVSDKSIKICTVARLSKEKGIDNAILACCELKKMGYDVTWTCVGDGYLKETLKEQINALGLDRFFYLIGADSNPYRYMANCDVYVQPSRFESYGITVAEAAILHKKMVVSDIPSFHEIMGDSPNVIYTSIEPIKLACSIEKSFKMCEETDAGVVFDYKSEMQAIYDLLQ